MTNAQIMVCIYHFDYNICWTCRGIIHTKTCLDSYQKLVLNLVWYLDFLKLYEVIHKGRPGFGEKGLQKFWGALLRTDKPLKCLNRWEHRKKVELLKKTLQVPFRNSYIFDWQFQFSKYVLDIETESNRRAPSQ